MHRVEICGMNTQSLPKLKNAELCELMKKVKQGDAEAHDLFVIANVRLVLSVVQRFNNKGTPDDLFQVGMVGLLKAVDGFDTSFNVRFSTYAVPMIMGEIRRFLKESSGIKVSRSMRDVAYKALKCKEEMELRNHTSPDLAEIAAEIDVPIKEVVCALDAVSEPISLMESVYCDGEDSLMLMDQIGDAKQSEDVWSQNLLLCEAIKALPQKERNVLLMRYYNGNTQVEISKKIGISQAQVSRLEKNALSRIKSCIE